MKNKTQLLEAKIILTFIGEAIESLETANPLFSDIVLAAQNSPPDGGSDLSIDEATWYKLRDLRDAIRQLVSAYQSFKI